MAPKYWLIKPMTTTGKVHQRQQWIYFWSFFSTRQHVAHHHNTIFLRHKARTDRIACIHVSRVNLSQSRDGTVNTAV
jgi:hypothetical protein